MVSCVNDAWNSPPARWRLRSPSLAKFCRGAVTRFFPGRSSFHFVLDFITNEYVKMGAVYGSCSNLAATSVRKFAAITRPPNRADPASLRQVKITALMERQISPPRPRNLSMLKSRLGGRYSFGWAIVATTNRKNLPFVFAIILAQVADAW